MRIVHVIDDLGVGGAEQVVASLAKCLARRGHDVKIVCLRDIGKDPIDIADLKRAGVEIIELGKPDGFHASTLRKLEQLLKSGRVDVIHTHNHLVHHYGAVAGRLAHTPAILNTLHGTASMMGSASWSKALFWVTAMIGDRVVAVCPQVDTVMAERFRLPARKRFVIDNGIDLGKFSAIARRARARVLWCLEPWAGSSG